MEPQSGLCFTGCPPEAVVKALGLEMKDLFPEATVPHPADRKGRAKKPVKAVTPLQSSGLKLADLAEAKRIPEIFLREIGLREFIYSGIKAVRIPYFDPGGEARSIRFRLSLRGEGGLYGALVTKWRFTG